MAEMQLTPMKQSAYNQYVPIPKGLITNLRGIKQQKGLDLQQMADLTGVKYTVIRRLLNLSPSKICPKQLERLLAFVNQNTDLSITR